MGLAAGEAISLEGAWNGRTASIGWDADAMTIRGEFESVEGTLQVAAQHAPLAEGRATVWTGLSETRDAASTIAPEDHALTETSHANRSATADLIGVQNGIPLVRDH
jgi:hypothetical protein